MQKYYGIVQEFAQEETDSPEVEVNDSPNRSNHDRIKNASGHLFPSLWRTSSSFLFVFFLVTMLEFHPVECSNLSIYPSKIEGVLIQEPIRHLPQVNGQVAAVKQNVGGAPLCLSKSGDVGVCMFLKSCLDLRGTLHGTCAKSFFLASCCVLPNANTSSNAVVGVDGGKSTVKPNFFEEVIMKEIEGFGNGTSRPTSINTDFRTTKRWIKKATTAIYKGYTVPDWYKYKSSSRPSSPFTISTVQTVKSAASTRKAGQFGSAPMANNSAAWFRPNGQTTHSPQHMAGFSHSTTPVRTKWWGSDTTPIQPGSAAQNKPGAGSSTLVESVTPLPDVVLVMPDGAVSGSTKTNWNGMLDQQGMSWSQGGSMVSANSNGQGSYVFNINMQVDSPKNSQQQGTSFAVIHSSPNVANNNNNPHMQTGQTSASSNKNVTLTVATASNPVINGNIVPTPNDAMFVGTDVDNFLLWPNVGPQQTVAPSDQGSPSFEMIFPVNLTATAAPSTTPTTTSTTQSTTTPTTTTTSTTTPTTTTTSTTTTTTSTTTPTTTTTPSTTTTPTTTTTTTTTPTTTTPTTSTTAEETSTSTTEETIITESPTTTVPEVTTKIWTKWVPPARFTVPTRPPAETAENSATTTATWTRWVPPERFTFPPTTATVPSATPASVVDATSQITITLSEICGITPLLWKRIVGGTDAKLGQFPWQVSLRRIVGFISSHRCGATLVHPRWILTAAHCASDIPTEKMVVRIGEYDFSDSNSVYPHIDMRVAERIIHEKFNFLTFENDLALLRLAEPINLAPHIIPACIAPYKNYTGSMGTISGWGRLSQGGALPPVLHSVQVPFISKSECEGWFDNGDRHQDVESCFICAGYKGGGKDACQGDSGGPIVQQVDGRWSLVGVISWGIGCADANLPGVSTLVPLFADWIQRHSNGDVYMPDFYLNKYGIPPSLTALSALTASSKIAKPQFSAL